jgi:anti-sigma factor RsiW
VSHLREQISALIDGELAGAELDRANAHLAACGRCRAEAAALRQLKRELRALAGGPRHPGGDTDLDGAAGRDGTDEELTRRLLAMAGPGGPVPSRRFRREQFRRNRREQSDGRLGSGRSGPGSAAGTTAARRPPREPRHRGRYMAWSAVSIVVVGIGAAAFSMGGGSAEPGPKVTPQLEMFSVEHAINSGDVPFPDPTQVMTARP